MDKKTYSLQPSKSELEIQLCADDERVIAKMYKRGKKQGYMGECA